MDGGKRQKRLHPDDLTDRFDYIRKLYDYKITK